MHLFFFDRDPKIDNQPDFNEKVANATLGLLRLSFGRSLEVKILDDGSLNFKKRKHSTIKKAIALAALIFLSFPINPVCLITLPVILIGCIAASRSKSLHRLEKEFLLDQQRKFHHHSPPCFDFDSSDTKHAKIVKDVMREIEGHSFLSEMKEEWLERQRKKNPSLTDQKIVQKSLLRGCCFGQVLTVKNIFYQHSFEKKEMDSFCIKIKESGHEIIRDQILQSILVDAYNSILASNPEISKYLRNLVDRMKKYKKRMKGPDGLSDKNLKKIRLLGRFIDIDEFLIELKDESKKISEKKSIKELTKKTLANDIKNFLRNDEKQILKFQLSKKKGTGHTFVICFDPIKNLYIFYDSYSSSLGLFSSSDQDKFFKKVAKRILENYKDKYDVLRFVTLNGANPHKK